MHVRPHRNENIYQLTQRLQHAQHRDVWRYAMGIAAVGAFYLADIGLNAYWKATTGHSFLECVILHSPGCDAPSLKLHGE